jgi:phosphatidylserine decarboxylase
MAGIPIVLTSIVIGFVVFILNISKLSVIVIVYLPFIVLFFTLIFIFLRFYRTPKRKIIANPNMIVSPADGNIIYIRRIEKGEIPVAVKGNVNSRLEELTKTPLLDESKWLIGINMTPLDVHKNCAPISGIISLNQHFNGRFLSLKDKHSITENERNTYVIQGRNIRVGVIQIASRLVRRIDTYVKEGDCVDQGDWIGMIRFGSQVDLILPEKCEILVREGDQIYARSTVIAHI